MKKIQIFSVAASLCLGLAACNNDKNGDTASSDSSAGSGTSTETASGTTGSTGSETTTGSSTGDYAALADSFRVNSEAGNYVDPRSGKSVRISVDPKTGAKLNAETNEPISRYVDRRNWWVYDAANDQQIGEAKEVGGSIKFKGDKNDWVDYDSKWKHDGDEMKYKEGDTKIKVEKDGDIKIKDGNTKIKSDEEGTKMKSNGTKIKTDEDGTKVKD